jgi:beta-aspartyl-peptidase (threonine type)
MIHAVGACAGCASRITGPAAREAIPKLLAAQEAAWNAGDVDAFMEPYWRSPELTFSSGGKVAHGWTSTLENYHKRYPNREAMGRLTFSDLEITELGPGAALVLGRWHLDRDDPVGGAFTLVWRRQSGRWLIIHDHTSREGP